MAEKKQHVDIHRKLKLRQTLLEKAGSLEGAFYVPFIGEGDIAAELYTNNKIYGADADCLMVTGAKKRLPKAEIITADCDTFPFNKDTATFCLADFDSYSYPYDSFRSFFEGAEIASQCVVIFTDGQRQAIIRTGSYRTPDGEKHKLRSKTEKREVYNFYYNKTLLPWFKAYIKPWTIIYITKYLRDGSMCCWGAIIARPNGKGKTETATNADLGVIKPYKFDAIKKANYLKNISNGHTRGYAATLVGISRATVCDHMKADSKFAQAISEAEGDALGKVENALHEAAVSGNVTAIQVFLYNRDPKRWSDRRNIQLAGEGGGPIKVDLDAKGKLISILNRLAAKAGENQGDRKP